MAAGLFHAGENRSFDSFKKLDESRLTRLENGCEIGGTSKAGANSPLRRLDPEALVEENHERDCGRNQVCVAAHVPTDGLRKELRISQEWL